MQLNIGFYHNKGYYFKKKRDEFIYNTTLQMICSLYRWHDDANTQQQNETHPTYFAYAVYYSKFNFSQHHYMISFMKASRENLTIFTKFTNLEISR